MGHTSLTVFALHYHNYHDSPLWSKPRPPSCYERRRYPLFKHPDGSSALVRNHNVTVIIFCYSMWLLSYFTLINRRFTCFPLQIDRGSHLPPCSYLALLAGFEPFIAFLDFFQCIPKHFEPESWLCGSKSFSAHRKHYSVAAHALTSWFDFRHFPVVEAFTVPNHVTVAKAPCHNYSMSIPTTDAPRVQLNNGHLELSAILLMNSATILGSYFRFLNSR